MNIIASNIIRRLFSFLLLYALMTHSISPASSAPQSTAAEYRPFVLVVQPSDNVTDALWFEAVDRHIKYSAIALNMKVENFFAGDDRTKIVENVQAKIKSSGKPDYLVFSNQIGMGVELLNICEDMGIKSFMYGSPLTERSIEEYGGPRQNLKSWIGQIIPDDEQAGYDLASTLIRQARETKKQNNDATPIRVIGITGTASTPASVERTNGLRRAISSQQDVELLQIVSARWSTEIAAKKFDLLTARHGESDVVWVANNDMALAVLEKARSFDNFPKIGGFDWVPPAIEALEENGLSAAVGGHEIEIAYALMLLKDYHNGNDYADETRTTSIESKLITLTPNTKHEYVTFLEKLSKGDVDYGPIFKDISQDKDAFSNISIEEFKKRVPSKDDIK